MNEIKDLEKLSKKLRKTVLKMCYHAGGGHIAPSYSSVELMTTLYFKILNLDKNNQYAHTLYSSVRYKPVPWFF